MAEIGAFPSSEEHGPAALVAQAKLAEEAGMHSIFISDHFHPWIDRQGESPFVWSVIGAISATTSHKVTTGVTCPTVRVHPTILAQAAAATSQLLLDGNSSSESVRARRSTSTSWAIAGLRSRQGSRCSKKPSG